MVSLRSLILGNCIAGHNKILYQKEKSRGRDKLWFHKRTNSGSTWKRNQFNYLRQLFSKGSWHKQKWQSFYFYSYTVCLINYLKNHIILMSLCYDDSTFCWRLCWPICNQWWDLLYLKISSQNWYLSFSDATLEPWRLWCK